MARKYTATVFDDNATNVNTWTEPKFNALLGSADQLAIQVLVDQISGTNPTLTMQIEHSNDQRNWLNLNGTAAEINAAALTAGTLFDVVVSYAGTTPALGFIRFRVILGGTTPQAHVKIMVTGRDQGAA